MSLYNYQIVIAPNGDCIPQLVPPLGPPFQVPFNHTDFQQWLSEQSASVQATAVLSNRQNIIKAIKALTMSQWQDGATVSADKKDKIAYWVAQLAFVNEVV